MTGFTIPDYYDIIPRSNIHPSYEVIQKRALAKTIQVLGESAANNALHDQPRYALFWSLFAPNDVVDWRLQVAVQWHHWTIELIDACDTSDKHTKEACTDLHDWINGMIAIVEGKDHDLDVPRRWTMIYELYKAIRKQVAASSTHEFQLRLERDTIELLNGFAAEAVMLPPKYASLQAWCKHREKKSAARAICRWLEWLLEVDLPGWLTEDVMMADIEQFCGNIMAYQSDVINYRAPKPTSDEPSKMCTVTIFMELNGGTIQQAIDDTDALARATVGPIKVLQGDLMSKLNGDKELSVRLTRYLVAMQRLGPASLWSSPR